MDPNITFTPPPLPVEATTPAPVAPEAPKGAAVVVVEVSLPMTASQFRAQEEAFKEALAAAAGPQVQVDQVIIKSVTERSTRRVGSRKLLATSVDVEVEIRTNDAGAILQDLTQEALTTELGKKGLPPQHPSLPKP